jgi:hypothetical protein
MYFLVGKYMTEELAMRDATGDPATLELLRAQRSRLADRLRPPWWFLPGAALVWALVLASPFSSRYLSTGDYWAIAGAALAVAWLLQWGLERVTGMKVGPRPGRVLRDGLFYYRPGRPALIAMLVVSLAGTATEGSLIHHGLPAAAIVVAAVAVAAEVALQQVRLREIRRQLRDGGATA